MFGSMVSRSAKHAALTRYVDRSPSPHLLAAVVAKSAAKLPGKVDVKNMVDLSKPRMMFLDIETWEPSPLDPFKLWPCLTGIDWLGQIKPGATTGRTESDEAVWQRLLKTAQEQWASLERTDRRVRLDVPYGTRTGRWSSDVPQAANTPSAAYKPTHGGYNG